MNLKTNRKTPSRIFFLCLVIVCSNQVASDQLDFNNGTVEQYKKASILKGGVREIQARTKGLWPRVGEGFAYDVKPNNVQISETEDIIKIKTNNLPDHVLTTTNPNCAKSQNYTFKIPKNPKILEKPREITKSMQVIGVATNGVVIAGPYDSQNKIAPYNRIVDQCASHADPEGMYHYHFAPLCMKDSSGKIPAVEADRHIGWSFDGFKIFGLADRESHMPEIDLCNGHTHNDKYHYHVTRDFPFFMGCYVAKPIASNFQQKRGKKKSSNSSCPKGILKSQNFALKGSKQGRPGKPNFAKAEKLLGVSTEDLKRALGPPPGDFSRAAEKLSISEKKLRDALDK